MRRQLIRNALLLDPEQQAPVRASLLLEDGRIRDRFLEGARLPGGVPAVDLGDVRLAPGFIDLHQHGELVFARSNEITGAFDRTSRQLARHGTTAFLATTVAWTNDRLIGFMTQARRVMTRSRWPGAQPIGVHLEGPWINPQAAGAQPSDSIRAFDADQASQIIDPYEEIISMVTLAPECGGSAQLLDVLARRRVIASLGHSLASSEEIDAAVGSGMTHVTHLFNAMGGMHHREPGVAGCVMNEPRLSCDLICDGVHVHPAMIALAARALGERMVLITDRIEPPADGRGSFGSGEIVDDGRALRLRGGRLAGSTLSLDRAVGNARSFAGLSELEAVAATTLRPARVLGIEAERGTLRVGARADFALLDETGAVVSTWIGGQPVDWSEPGEQVVEAQ